MITCSDWGNSMKLSNQRNLSRKGAVERGARGVSPAVFGVPSKTFLARKLNCAVGGASDPSAGRRRGRPGRSRSPFLTASLWFGLLLLAVPMTRAQTVDQFFLAGATNYLHTNIDQAKKLVTNGLALYPNDPKLTNLWALLNRQQQSQNSDSQQQDKKDQQNKDQQKQDQQKSDQQKQDEQKRQEEQKKQEEAKKQQEQQQAKKDKDKEQDQAGKSGDKKDQPDPKEAEAGQMAKIRMTPQQAQQLLDTMKNEERTMIFTPQMKSNRADRVFKDW